MEQGLQRVNMDTAKLRTAESLFSNYFFLYTAGLKIVGILIWWLSYLYVFKYEPVD